jgi:hypothetical protein
MNKPKLYLSCSVTKSHLKEFFLLKFSAEQYHDCKWFLSCDKDSFESLKNDENCFCFNDGLQDGKVFGDQIEIDNFFKVIKGKFNAAKRCIEKFGYTLLVDCDIIFTNKVDQYFFNILNSEFSVGACPHYQWNKDMDNDWGYYNVGLCLLKNIDFINEWEQLTFKKVHKFEQVPYQKILETNKYLFSNFPINYNMGWWRFNNQLSQYRLNSIYIENGDVKFDGLDIVCFHFHTFIDSDAYSARYKNIIFDLLSKSQKYHNLLNKYKELQITT